MKRSQKLSIAHVGICFINKHYHKLISVMMETSCYMSLPDTSHGQIPMTLLGRLILQRQNWLPSQAKSLAACVSLQSYNRYPPSICLG